MKPQDVLQNSMIPFYYSSFHSLDKYYRITNSPFQFITVKSSLVQLAKLFDSLEFPGLAFCDAAVNEGGSRTFIKCMDDNIFPIHSHPLLNLYYSIQEEKYFDAQNIYGFLKTNTMPPYLSSKDSPQIAWENAILLSRYRFIERDNVFSETVNFSNIAIETIRIILLMILTGPYPWKGLNHLMNTGFINRYLPEVSELNETVHSKENHPEGNAWEHTLETFRYRKSVDPLLAVSLLLHDLGKPQSTRHKEKYFDGHAETGARRASRLLQRLGFADDFIKDAAFLIKYHMLPGVLHQLPLYRTEKIMASPLFPLLLELFRCDLSSTFTGPEPYYQACKVYREFLRNRKNPFRNPEGKKLLRQYVE